MEANAKQHLTNTALAEKNQPLKMYAFSPVFP